MEAIREGVTGVVLERKYGKEDNCNDITYCLISDDSNPHIKYFGHRANVKCGSIPAEGTPVVYTVTPKLKPNDKWDRATQVEILREDAA